MKILRKAARLETYKLLYDSCSITPAIYEDASDIVDKMTLHANVYGLLADEFNIRWWQIVGILHHMESGLDFEKHLANGDPLTADTVNVPARIMAPRLAPYTFLEAARTALTRYRSPRGWGSIHVVDLSTALGFLEQWNGLGYWMLDPPQPSPYIWSGTTVYKGGKFRSDGVYDVNLKSKQIGAAVFCKFFNLK